MLNAISKSVVAAAILLAAVSCGYEAGTAFKADGSVTVTLKFLFPKSLMQSPTTVGVQGLSPADIDKANASLQKKYPGGKVSIVTEGDETGAEISIPFKTEKDAFTFLTTPSTLNPTGVTSGSNSSTGIDLGNTGGLFSSATHTTSGSTDTYTFKTQPSPLPSPSPGTDQTITNDEVASLFTVTFTLTVPHEITSAPGALFTLDRKSATWKLNWTRAETLTATTAGGLGGLAANSASGLSTALLIGVALVTLGVGFILGLLSPGRRLNRMAASPAAAAAPEPAGFAPPAVEAPPPADAMGGPPAAPSAGGWQGPPPGMPPPTPPGG